MDQLRRDHPLPPLKAIHIHHGLQSHADDWLLHCERTAQAYGIAFTARKVKVDLHAGPLVLHARLAAADWRSWLFAMRPRALRRSPTWIAIEEERFASEWPDIELLPTVYAGEDQARATQMASDLMNANPDLTGIIGQCTTSAPGVAQAVRDADRIGEVFTVGVGTPQSMLPYLQDGSSSGSILWDVEALGYLTAWAGVQLANGVDFEAEPNPGFGIEGATYDADSMILLLGPPRSGKGLHIVINAILRALGEAKLPAAIMVVVFGAFLLEDDRVLKLMGTGLATAIFLSMRLPRPLLRPDELR